MSAATLLSTALFQVLYQVPLFLNYILIYIEFLMTTRLLIKHSSPQSTIDLSVPLLALMSTDIFSANAAPLRFTAQL